LLDSSLERVALSVAAYENEDLDDQLWAWEDKRISNKGKGDECSKKKEKTKKMTLSAETEKFKDMAGEREKNRART
jgi:hypothetical protein